MSYSVELRERRYVEAYGFLSFARNLNNKYGQKLIDSAKKSATDTFKIANKRAIQKTAEATGDKVKSYSRKLANETHSNDVSKEIPKERYIYLQKKDKTLLMS